MAMISCPECKAKISSSAAACPQCGAKRPKPTSRLTIFIGGLFAIGVAGAVFSHKEPPPPVSKTPDQIKAEQQANAIFSDAVNKARALKASLKNPTSFELVKLGKLSDGTLCVVYRGTNSFNAITTEQKAISPIGAFVDFNKSCAGKTSEDLTHVKHAM